MEYPKVIKNFTKCPVCHGTQLAARFICDAEKALPTAFVSLNNHMTIIDGPSSVLPRAIISHYDVCLNCGTQFCSRLEVIRQTPQAYADLLKGTR